MVYVLQGNYGYGWDDLCEYDSHEEAYDDLVTYNREENYPHRIIKRHVDTGRRAKI